MNDIIILGLLLDGPKHGYRLKQDAAMLGGAQQLHNNTVYPLLKRFEKSGWISKSRKPGERGQTRVMYSLTAEGRRVLVERLADFAEADAASGPAFRLRVGFFAELNATQRERILLVREEYLAERLARVKEIAKAHEMNEWAASTVGFVMKELQMELKWIEQLRKESGKER
jgi:DNA-binding PadR family transcriptional regulator